MNDIVSFIPTCATSTAFFNPHILSPHYLRHCRVVVSRASFLRLALIQISST